MGVTNSYQSHIKAQSRPAQGLTSRKIFRRSSVKLLFSGNSVVSRVARGALLLNNKALFTGHSKLRFA
jgi:hypothetical protein